MKIFTLLIATFLFGMTQIIMAGQPSTTLFPGSTSTGGGWYSTQGYGLMNANADGKTIYHQHLGWIFADRAQNGGIWFYDYTNNEWFWAYPNNTSQNFMTVNYNNHTWLDQNGVTIANFADVTGSGNKTFQVFISGNGCFIIDRYKRNRDWYLTEGGCILQP